MITIKKVSDFNKKICRLEIIFVLNMKIENYLSHQYLSILCEYQNVGVKRMG